MSICEDDNIKITLLGDSGIGKTCIIRRVTKNNFDERSNPTVGGSFASQQFNINGKLYTCDFWDTAGQEQYRSMGRIFYKDSYIVCLVYDITREDTFKSLKNIWYPELKNYGEKYQVIAVVGNKCDLLESEKVSEDEARKFADEIEAYYMAVSAKSGDNIQLLFETLLKKYLGVEFVEKVSISKKSKGRTVSINSSDHIITKEEKKKKFC